MNLSEPEKQILDAIRTATERCGAKAWIVGGWVRDKLMNESSADMDIVIHGADPLEFSLQVYEYSRITYDIVGHKPPHLNDGEKDHRVAIPVVIKFRTVPVIRVDVVQLSTFGLSDDECDDISKCLIIDAMDRDFCINSLFCDILTLEVVDPTGKGKQNLSDRLICTPSSPRIVLEHDPIRIFRAARLAGKLGFKISEEICLECKKEIYKVKVRETPAERKKKEILGIIKLKSKASIALEYILRWGLWNVAFFDAVDYCPLIEYRSFDSHANNVKKSTAVLGLMESLGTFGGFREFSGDELTVLYYCSVSFASSACEYEEQITEYTQRMFSIGKKRLFFVSRVIKAAVEFRRVLDNWLDAVYARSGPGVIIRFAHTWWRVALYVGIVSNVMSDFEDPSIVQHDDAVKEKLNMFSKLDQRIIEDKICHPSTWQMKRLVKEKKIQKHFDVKKGELMKQLIHMTIIYQLDHPGCTKSDVMEFLSQQIEKEAPVEET